MLYNKGMVQSYEDLKSYQRQKRIMLVLSNYLLDMIVQTTTNRYEGRNLHEWRDRPAYAWITGRLQVIAYIHIPQVCTAMHESHMRVFEHWKRIDTPHISHFPMSYEEFIVHVQFKTTHYNARQDEKARLVRHLVDKRGFNRGMIQKWGSSYPHMLPDDVRKTEDDFWEVELTRSDNLDHALPLADRLRPRRQRRYPLVLD